MKKTILTLAIAVVFAACGDKKANEVSTTTTTNNPDTTGLSQFNQWKEEQQVVSMQGVDVEEQSSNTEVSSTPRQSIRQAAPAPRVIYREREAAQPVVKYTKPRTYGTPASPSREPISRADMPTGTGSDESESTGTGVGSGTGVSTGVGTGTDVVTTTPVPEVKKKEGWSKAAKGTAIGAGSGAVLGAILSKNKGKGAVIGGVVGAAGGYVLGRSKDKKDGRY